MFKITARCKRNRTLRYILISWHLISTFCMLFAFILTPAASTNIDENAGPSTLNVASVTDVITSTADPTHSNNNKSNEDNEEARAADCSVDILKACPNIECRDLSAYCIECDFNNNSCVYGIKQTTKCSPKPNVNCTGDQIFEKEYECSYCYQLPASMAWCNQSTDCALNKPRSYYPARPHFVSTCWTKTDVLCLGRRCFHKQFPCNWSKGYKWSTAMLLSIFLGGFGADRFYLGLWREGIGKLLSFGGLGVWTLVDVILIGVGYIGPYDGSLYL